MSLVDEIRREVQEIARERNLPEYKAFGYWFLERFEDLSPEDAEITILDGPWDGGRDAVYLDEDNNTLKIYQFKYSEDPSCVRQGLVDLQKGLINEQERLARVGSVNLVLVTLARLDLQQRQEISDIRARGDRVQKRNFLLKRLLPWKIMMKTREFLREHTGEGTDFDKKFRSLAYHITWVYRRLLSEMIERDLARLHEKVDEILDRTLDPLFKGVYDFLEFTQAEVPRCLKSKEAQNSLERLFGGRVFKEVARNIRQIFSPAV